MLRIALLVTALAGTAFGDPEGPNAPRRLDVAVDASVEIEVGYAIGFRCDDPTVVHGEMKTKTEATNVFVATGLKVGTTQCRAGTDPRRPTLLFDIHVLAKKKAPR